MSWDKLCGPKTDGGLGFRNLYTFNFGLLAKQGWRIISNPISLVARLLKTKYFPNCSFMDLEVYCKLRSFGEAYVPLGNQQRGVAMAGGEWHVYLDVG